METRQRPKTMMMSSSTIRRGLMIVLTLMMVIMPLISSARTIRNGAPKNMLVDTDVDTDDVFAILYLLKQPKSLLNIKAITVSANNWIDAGHGVNLLYDLLYMMGRDDIPVGVGGEGGITEDGEILPNVGGYLPLIEQKLSTAGGCRYRQAVPHGHGGLLDSDTNYGVRKMFLPKGTRHYAPLEQSTAQEVMLKTLSSGSTTVLLIGSHTNFAILLMTHPEVKRNIERIYIMGGAVKSTNPSGCCSLASRKMCQPNPCGDRGNLFDAIETDPWAEFNIFADPFAAYQVIHSGIPITLVPLDATNTIPYSEEFFSYLEANQATYESRYVYQSLRMVRDTWFSDGFYQSYFMWDSFAAGIAVAGIKNNHTMEANEFAVISLKRITVITSNEPYGIQDGSNPFFSNRTVPMFHLRKQGVHSGHVMTGIQDGFCLVPNRKGKCMDGYTIETRNSNGVQIQVAQRAKFYPGIHRSIKWTFSKSFLDMLNAQENSGLFDLQSEYPYYREVLYKPPFRKQYSGKPVVYDMDMSPGDFITLFYLLKVPQEVIDIKAITVTVSGWANAATIDIVYDILHMMGRDDIPVGLGEYFAIGQAYPPFNTTGSCKYRQSIPNGAGGYIDSDTLFGLAVDLPISPRRYTAHNSIKFGAQKDSQFPKLRQLRAQEVLHTVITTLQKDSKLTFLTGGPLTNIATMLSLNPSFESAIEEIYITGGSIHQNGNVHTIEENHKAEFNMFLDPIAAKKVIGSGVKTKLIPLDVLQKTSLSRVLEKMADREKTPEAAFVKLVLNKIHWLKSQRRSYSHTEKLAREVLGAVVMANEQKLGCVFKEKPITVMATGDISTDGWTKVDYLNGNPTWYLEDLNVESYEEELAEYLNHPLQSAKIANFTAQKKLWHTPNITYQG